MNLLGFFFRYFDGVMLFWTEWQLQASTHKPSFLAKGSLSTANCRRSIYSPDKDKLGLSFRMNNSLDFTSQLTDKHFTNITFRRQISLINRFYTGSLLHAGWGTGTTISPLNLVTKQLQVKAKAECVQIETRYHLKPSQRGKAGAAKRGGQMCSDRSALSLSSREFCLYCAPADRMLNSFY